MDLDLSFERELTPSDVVLVGAKRAPPTPVLKLRTSHHALARSLAEGKTQTEVALIHGYSQGRISRLCLDPAFQELIEHYRAISDEAFIDVQQQLRDFGLDALDELRERLQTEPKQFKVPDLIEVQKLILDRTGHGPKSTVNNTHRIAVLNEDTLRRIKEDAESRRLGAVRLLSGSEGPIDSFPGGEATATYSEKESPSGRESEGADLREEVRKDAEERTPRPSLLPISVD